VKQGKQGFWSEAAMAVLRANGRQDLIDKGDALAQRVAALVLAASERLRQYSERGDLYNGRGGLSDFADRDAVAKFEEFVGVRLKKEIKALEKLLEVFEDIEARGEAGAHGPAPSGRLPDWY